MTRLNRRNFTIENQSEIIIYQSQDGLTKVDVTFEGETAWLTLSQMAALFGRNKSTISRHLKNIFEEEELEREAVVANFATTASDGKTYQVDYYNLDAILSVGYRVKSKTATQFRIWASSILKEYLKKGFAMNDEGLKNLGGGVYFKELLERIRDIRSSEKVFYRQLLDLFATSSDYDKNTDEAKIFFATVQNKLHFAIHHHTASELVNERVDSEKDFMGLQTFKGNLPTLNEAKIAKNYLDKNELQGLNQLVSGYLDFAERQANREVVMTMKDWIKHIDNILQATGEDVLQGAGKVSAEQKDRKVESEYRKYQQRTLSQVEKDYLEEIKTIEKTIKSGIKTE